MYFSSDVLMLGVVLLIGFAIAYKVIIGLLRSVVIILGLGFLMLNLPDKIDEKFPKPQSEELEKTEQRVNVSPRQGKPIYLVIEEGEKPFQDFQEEIIDDVYQPEDTSDLVEEPQIEDKTEVSEPLAIFDTDIVIQLYASPDSAKVFELAESYKQSLELSYIYLMVFPVCTYYDSGDGKSLHGRRCFAKCICFSLG